MTVRRQNAILTKTKRRCFPSAKVSNEQKLVASLNAKIPSNPNCATPPIPRTYAQNAYF